MNFVLILSCAFVAPSSAIASSFVSQQPNESVQEDLDLNLPNEDTQRDASIDKGPDGLDLDLQNEHTPGDTSLEVGPDLQDEDTPSGALKWIKFGFGCAIALSSILFWITFYNTKGMRKTIREHHSEQLTELNDRQYCPEIRAVEKLQKHALFCAIIDTVATAVLILAPFEKDWTLFCIGAFLLLCHLYSYFNIDYHLSIWYNYKVEDARIMLLKSVVQIIREPENSYINGDSVRISTTWSIGMMMGRFSSIVLLITAIVIMIEFPTDDSSECNIFGFHLIVGGLCLLGLSSLYLKIATDSRLLIRRGQEHVNGTSLPHEIESEDLRRRRLADLRLSVSTDDEAFKANHLKHYEIEALKALRWFGGVCMVVGFVFMLVNFYVTSHVKSIWTSMLISGILMLTTGVIYSVGGHFIGDPLTNVFNIPVATSFLLYLNSRFLDYNAYSMVIFGLLQIVYSLQNQE